MAATTTLTMAPTVRHQFARTATLAIIRMPARRMVTGGLVTSWTACSSELAHGTDGGSVADFAVADFAVATDSVADFTMVVDLVAAGSMAGQDLEIGQASQAAAVALAALPEADFTAVASHTAAEADFMEVVASTEVAADSMAAVADTAVATGN
jgi:hypothetical protein